MRWALLRLCRDYLEKYGEIWMSNEEREKMRGKERKREKTGREIPKYSK